MPKVSAITERRPQSNTTAMPSPAMGDTGTNTSTVRYRVEAKNRANVSAAIRTCWPTMRIMRSKGGMGPRGVSGFGATAF